MPRTYDPAFRIGAGITLRRNEIPPTSYVPPLGTSPRRMLRQALAGVYSQGRSHYRVAVKARQATGRLLSRADHQE